MHIDAYLCINILNITFLVKMVKNCYINVENCAHPRTNEKFCKNNKYSKNNIQNKKILKY